MSGLPIPPPPDIDLSADRSSELLIAHAVTYAFAITAVILRVVSRQTTRAGFWWDDWLLIPATIFATSYAGLGVETPSSAGFGRHVWAIGYDKQVFEMKKLFAGEFFYISGLLCLNYSILALYWRIFNVSKLRFFVWAMAGITTAWYIASVTMALVQCSPISKLWNIFTPGFCSNSPGFYFGGALTHAILDFLLLLMPLPCIWQLQMNRTQKVLLTCVFAVGISTVVLSILRLVQLLKIDTTSIDLTWNFTDTLLYSVLELNVCIVATCIPALRPIYRFISTGSFMRPLPTERHDPAHSRPSPLSSLGPKQRLQRDEQGKNTNRDLSEQGLRKIPSSSVSSTLFKSRSKPVATGHNVGLFAQLEREGSDTGADFVEGANV